MQISDSLNAEQNDVELSRISARNTSSLLIVISALNFFRWRTFDPAMHWTWLGSVLVAVLTTLACTFWKKLNIRTLMAVFFVDFVVAAGATAESNLILIHRLDNFSPFGGFKIIAMCLAVLAPFPAIVGYLSIFGCAVIPVFLCSTAMLDVRSKIPLPEPGMTVVVCVAAAIGLAFRLRGIQIERENARLRAEKENLDEFARIILVLRDLTNTPLQVIELTTDLLRSGELETSEAVAKIDSSLARLKQISKTLSNHRAAEASIPSLHGLYDSAEPLTQFQKLLDELKRRPEKTR